MIKSIILGDGGIGKTALLNKYCNNHFMGDYIPSTIDIYEKLILHKSESIKFIFYDLAGQESYSRLRRQHYRDTDLVILAFSLDSVTSFENLETKWFDELDYENNERDKIPFLLVGTKLDLKKDNYRLHRMISSFIVENNIDYIECSAKTGVGINLFEKYLIKTIYPKVKSGSETKSRKRKCVLF